MRYTYIITANQLLKETYLFKLPKLTSGLLSFLSNDRSPKAMRQNAITKTILFLKFIMTVLQLTAAGTCKMSNAF